MSEVHDSATVARRIDRLAMAGESEDRQLGIVAHLSSNGMPFGIGVLVDGAVIRGQAGPASQFVQVLQESFNRMTTALFAEQADLGEATSAVFTGDLELSRSWEGSDEEVFTRYPDDPPPKLDELAVEDVLPYLRALAFPRFLHLEHARVAQPSGQEVVVGSMRVRMSRISAWWPLEADESTTVTYGDANPPAEGR